MHPKIKKIRALGIDKCSVSVSDIGSEADDLKKIHNDPKKRINNPTPCCVESVADMDDITDVSTKRMHII